MQTTRTETMWTTTFSLVALSVLVNLGPAVGFVPHTSQMAMKISTRRLRDVNDERPSFEPNLDLPPLEEPSMEDQNGLGLSLSLSLNEDDIMNKADQFLKDVGASANVLNELTNDSPPALLADEIVSELLGSQPVDFIADATLSEDAAGEIVLDTVDTTSTSDLLKNVEDSDDVSDDQTNVQAVLEASRQAAMEAEATFTADVIESTPETNGEKVEVSAKARAMVDENISKAIKEPLMTEKVEAPSVKKILKFAIPAIGVWLCSPLLSLIDTSAVGLLSGTAQQAALNPAVAVTDYAALLIAFMYTGTTNLVASAQESDHGVEGKPRTTNTLVTALQLSGYVGLGLGAVLFVFAKQLLRTMIGNDALDPVVFSAAMKYVRIRALGMPAAAFIGSAQAGSLGLQDIRSPLYVLVAAAVVNLFGDMAFVGSSNPLVGGAAGAAWATVFSQYAAVAFFVRWLCTKSSDSPQTVNLSGAIMELTGGAKTKGRLRRMRFSSALRFAASKLGATKPPASESETEHTEQGRHKEGSKTKKDTKTKKKEESFSIRGFLAGKVNPIDLAKIPKQENAREFAPYVLPVTSTQVGRVSSYVAMSHVVSSSLGTISMAAQQVIVSLFYCLTPVADSLSLTAQSLVPSIAEKKVSKDRASALRKIAANFLKAGGLFGALMSGSVAFIPFISGFFTSDPVVVSMVNSVAPLLVAVLYLHSFVCVGEGLLLGQKDLGFLGKMYAGFFAAVPYFMLRVKRTALAGGNASLQSVWKVFAGYQIFRTTAFMIRTAQLQRRTNAEANR